MRCGRGSCIDREIELWERVLLGVEISELKVVVLYLAER